MEEPCYTHYYKLLYPRINSRGAEDDKGPKRIVRKLNRWKGCLLPWGERGMSRPPYADRAAGFFMKRYEGKPEFEESFFKIV
jgi:hypothetical protein